MKSKFSPRQACIRDINGQVLTKPEEVLARWKEYGEILFKKPEEDGEVAWRNSVDAFEPPPLLEEVQAAVEKLKRRKTPGLDDIPSESLKESGKKMLEVLHRLVSKI